MFPYIAMESTGLRERNKQDKLRRIREAARALFLSQGYEATTTREVAARAGVATGTLFLYARDKQELVFLIFREEVGPLVERAFAALPEGDLVTRVAALFAAFFEHYQQSPELSRLFVKELPFLQGDKQAESARFTMAFVERIALLVEEARGRGEVRADAPALPVALNCFALYVFHLMSWFAMGAGDCTAALLGLQQALALQFQGIRS